MFLRCKVMITCLF